MPDVRYEPAYFHSISTGAGLVQLCDKCDLAEAGKASLCPSISDAPPGPKPLCFVCIWHEWSGSLMVGLGAKTWSPYLWETESMQLCDYYCEARKIPSFKHSQFAAARVWGFDCQNCCFKSFLFSFLSSVESDFCFFFGSKTGQQRVPNPQEGEHPGPLSSHASP